MTGEENNMAAILKSWIKLKEHLDHNDYDQINALQNICVNTDKISLKLELDYKLAVAFENEEQSSLKDVNEFMYFEETQLIGYIGICSFGGAGMPLEITGMVHPDYRQQGIFMKLHELVLAECKRRNSGNILLLSDKKSASGEKFVQKIGAVYKSSEYEMYLRQNYPEPDESLLCGIIFRKAKNSDAYEIARQNAIYFGDPVPDETNISEDDILLPEVEEKRGMTIYLAEKDNKIIGKVHLESSTETGAIYGLGVLPEYRGKGYGRAILLQAVRKLKEEHNKRIMLQVATENATALSLYQSCGFVETSTMDYFELKL
jgi:mycothiol synthase